MAFILGSYLLPALLLGLGLWMLMRLIRELGVPFRVRRVLFVALATISFAPVVSGGWISIYIPNGLTALLGALPSLHQPRLAIFAIVSFVLTAIAAGIVASLFVNDEEPWPRPASVSARVARVALPVAVIAGLLALFYGLIPDRKIPVHINRALVESVYGAQMDWVVATLDLEAAEEIWAERHRLRDLFETDEVMIKVLFPDKRIQLPGRLEGSVIFKRNLKSSSSSCSSHNGSYRNEGLMRCTWDLQGPFFPTKETLLYRRKNGMIDIELDYDAFLKNYPAPEPSLGARNQK